MIVLQGGNFPYIIPENGYLYVEITSTSSGALRFNNGHVQLTTSANNANSSNVFPCIKDEEWNITASVNLQSYNIRFVPFK